MKLYHFTSIETLRKILKPDCTKPGCFRFGKVNDFDDPFDRYRKDDIKCSEETTEKNKISLYKEIETEYKRLIDNTYAACFFLQKVEEEPYYDLKMWSHYGDRHKGCCLVFDKTIIDAYIANVEKELIHQFHQKIHYYIKTESLRKDIKVNIKNRTECKVYAEGLLKKNYKKLFFKKSACFKTENEYRYTVTCSDNKPFTFTILHSLIEIILGENVKGDVQQEIKNIISLYPYQNIEGNHMIYDLVDKLYKNPL